MLKKEIISEKNKKIHSLLQDYGFSFSDVNKMLRNKDVRLNGKVTKENVSVLEGDVVTFYYSEDMLKKKYDVVFENKEALVIYKFAGIETEGEKGLESVLKAIAVHRLDRNTEGLMVFAKTENTAEKLKNAFKNRKIHKFYVAEVVGEFVTDKQYDAYLLKDSENACVKIYQNAVAKSQAISTKIKTIKAGKESSLVEVELLTGRTHQIRAHLAYLSHPIIGDGKYGKNYDNKKFAATRQKLACFKLQFDYVGIEGLDNKKFEKLPNWWHLQPSEN